MTTPTRDWRLLWNGAGGDSVRNLEAVHLIASADAARSLWTVVDASNWNPDDLTPIMPFIDGLVCQPGVPRFDEHMAQAEAHGKPKGAYCWLYPQRPAQAEIERYAALLAPYAGRLQFRTWWDVETTPGLVTPPPSTVCAFLAAVFEANPEDGVYTSTGEWSTMTGNSRLFGSQALWDAAYGVSAPGLPPGWGQWAAWQYTSSGAFGGISGLDVSVFDPTMTLRDTTPGGNVGKFGIQHAIVDTKVPPDSKGRIPWVGVDAHGNTFNFNGCRPVAGLGALKPPVVRDDICAALHVDSSMWYPEGIVVMADDSPDGASASTYFLPVPVAKTGFIEAAPDQHPEGSVGAATFGHEQD